MIISSVVYLIQNDSYLMLYRNKKKNDLNANKWIGVGGKKESNETIEECAIRETLEETGLQIQALDFRGIVHFEYENKEPEEIYVYTSTSFTGKLCKTREGTLSWIPKAEILNLALWEGDKIFLEYLLQENKDLFHLKLVYDKYDKLIHYELGEKA